MSPSAGISWELRGLDPEIQQLNLNCGVIGAFLGRGGKGARGGGV